MWKKKIMMKTVWTIGITRKNKKDDSHEKNDKNNNNNNNNNSNSNNDNNDNDNENDKKNEHNIIRMIIVMKSNISTHMYVHITQTQAHTQKRSSYDNDNIMMRRINIIS